eukprot:5946742-Prymnesium_polylepis.1
MGCAYAVADGMRLLVDTGSAVSIVCGGRTVALPEFGPSSPLQQLPSGVDGILGIGTLRAFKAAEFDWR